MLRPESIQEFKRLYEDRFKEKLEDSDAERIATRVLNLYISIYGERLGLKIEHKANDIDVEIRYGRGR